MESSAAPHAQPLDVEGQICPGCGYSLFGIESDRCPECGLIVDRTILGRSQIPWTHRKSIGHWRAFWQTAWRATIRPKMIALDVNRPVSFSDAQRFRMTCIAIAWISAMAWVIGGISTLDSSTMLVNPKFGERITGIVAVGFALLVFLILITGVSSYFFHPRSISVVRQNRAVALSYYASAPLAWTWIFALLPVPLVFLNLDQLTANMNTFVFLPIVCACYVAGALLISMMLSSAIRMLRQTTHCSARRKWAMGIILPIAWMVLATGLIAIPALMLFVAIVFTSLH